MGLSFPLANALIQRAERSVGTRAGVLYFANTAGGVAGSLGAGFALLPALGIQRTATMLALVAAFAALPLYFASGGARRAEPGRLRALATSLLVSTTAIWWWVNLPSDYVLSRALLFPLQSAYAVSEGVTELVAVTDGPDGGRVLVTNGHPMSSTELASQRYMRAMAHVPLLLADEPARVLVMCFGVGNTVHAATLHPSVRRVEVVDLSRHILEHASYFREVNRDVLQRSPCAGVRQRRTATPADGAGRVVRSDHARAAPDHARRRGGALFDRVLRAGPRAALPAGLREPVASRVRRPAGDASSR